MLSSVWQFFLSGDDADLNVSKNVKDALSKMQCALILEKQTLWSLFLEIECAQDRKGVEIGFPKINNYLRYLLRINPATESYKVLRTELEKIKTSAKFSGHLKRASSLEEALTNWKTDVLQDLSFKVLKCREEDLRRNKLDRQLLKRYLPELSSKIQNDDKIQERPKLYRESSKRRRIRGNSGDDRKYGNTSRHNYFDEMWRKKMCIDFKDGKCRRGSACRFEHSDY